MHADEKSVIAKMSPAAGGHFGEHFMIDAYRCRNGLPTAEVEAYFREAFGFEELETNFVVRGTKYPAADC